VNRLALAWRLLPFVGRHALAHPWRLLIQLVAIAAGVALAFGVNRINAAALAEISAAERSLAGLADLAVVGPAEGFDESWYARVAADAAVAAAAPLLEVDVTMDSGADRSADHGGAVPAVLRPAALHVVGVDALRSALLEPDLVGTPAAGADPAALLDDGLFLSPAALRQLHVAIGGTVTAVIGTERRGLRVAGTLPAVREAMATMDIGFAQWRLQRLGRLTRIDVKFLPGADVQARVRAWNLPPNLRIERREVAVQRQQGLSRAYRVNLDVLSMVALFTGAFLVFSLQSQAIVVRRPQLALLRMLGATRGAVVGMLLVESLAVGLLGALLGLALGAALAEAALRTLGGDLGGGYFPGVQAHVALDAAGVALFLALGLAASLAGTWLPAREAAAQPPAPALKTGGDAGPGSQRPRAWAAVCALAIAALLLFLPPVRGVPAGAYAAIALILTGTIALKPLLAPWCFGPLARWISSRRVFARYPAAWLAATRLARLPRFAAVGAAGVLASFALMVSMATMVHSFRYSFDAWLSQVLAADLYARAAPAGATGRFSECDLQRLRDDPDVARVEFTRTRLLQLDALRPPVALLARAVDRQHAEQTLPLIGAQENVPATQIPVWISEPVALQYALAPGAALQLPLDTAPLKQHAAQPLGVRVRVAGVWRDYARQGGSIVMDLADYQRLTGDSARSEAALWLKPGAGAAAVAQRLQSALDAPAVQFAPAGQIRAISLRLFDRSFQVTYLLEWTAIGIGLLGLATTFSAQAIARTREFGMLRHLGVTRTQVQVLLAAEAALVTALAIALGLAAGLAIAAILVYVVNPQSFHWTMELRVPAGMLAVLAAMLLVAAVLTAAIAGRRALALDAVRAVKDDW